MLVTARKVGELIVLTPTDRSGVSSVGFVVVLSLIASNVAGHTKSEYIDRSVRKAAHHG